MCGSANGITITLNKHQGIRAAICWEPEIASLARKHNDANVCSMPARFIDRDTAIKIVDTFLSTEFEGGRAPAPDRQDPGFGMRMREVADPTPNA